MYVVHPKLGVTSTKLASCNIIFQKGGLQSATTLFPACLWFKIQVLLTEYFIIPTTGFNEQSFQREAKVTSHTTHSYQSRPYMRHTQVDKVRFMFKLIPVHIPVCIFQILGLESYCSLLPFRKQP